MPRTPLALTASAIAALVLLVSTVSAQTKPAAKPEELDTLLAPIALYPDQLLAQMLLCAATPGDVKALNGWLGTTKSLKGTDLQDAAMKAGFEPSFVAMVLFPQTVKMMADQIDWTTKLGQAFTANRSAVFDSIQRLRAQAQKIGSLKSNAQQDVETKTTSSGQQVIVIEPANPQIVYVPQYNPTVVYAPPATTTTTVVVEKDNSADAAAAGVIGFAAGIAIGAAMDNDYYYGPYGWGGPAYMYNDAWDDYLDHREDAREDWMEHREDTREDRGDRARSSQEQRTERQETRQENRPESTADRQQRRTDAQTAAQNRTSTSTQSRTTSQESRGYKSGSGTASTAQRSGTRSDAFSGYSSGKSQRAASARGQSSRSSARSSGGGGGRRRR
jgi:hypothetical protein